MTQSVVYMIAGPNEAGKTTAAMKFLPKSLGIEEFVNADEIARGLNPLKPNGQAVSAGRIMLNRMDALVAGHKSFAFETTGASQAFIHFLEQAKTAGYWLGLLYLWLPTSEFAKERVRLRIAQGGHAIPEDIIERRFKRGLINLVRLYLPLMDEAFIVDGRFPSGERLIAKKRMVD